MRRYINKFISFNSIRPSNICFDITQPIITEPVNKISTWYIMQPDIAIIQNGEISEDVCLYIGTIMFIGSFTLCLLWYKYDLIINYVIN